MSLFTTTRASVLFGRGELSADHYDDGGPGIDDRVRMTRTAVVPVGEMQVGVEMQMLPTKDENSFYFLRLGGEAQYWMNAGTALMLPIWFSIFSTRSLAPPWSGP